LARIWRLLAASRSPITLLLTGIDPTKTQVVDYTRPTHGRAESARDIGRWQWFHRNRNVSQNAARFVSGVPALRPGAAAGCRGAS